MGTREIRHRPLDQWHYIRALVVMRHVGDHQRHGSCVNAANGSHKKSPPHSILYCLYSLSLLQAMIVYNRVY